MRRIRRRWKRSRRSPRRLSRPPTRSAPLGCAFARNTSTRRHSNRLALLAIVAPARLAAASPAAFPCPAAASRSGLPEREDRLRRRSHMTIAAAVSLARSGAQAMNAALQGPLRPMRRLVSRRRTNDWRFKSTCAPWPDSQQKRFQTVWKASFPPARSGTG